MLWIRIIIQMLWMDSLRNIWKMEKHINELAAAYEVDWSYAVYIHGLAMAYNNKARAARSQSGKRQKPNCQKSENLLLIG